MNGNRELALSWFKTADEDILAAEHEIRYEDAVLRVICFHCQQAVEKYLKGYLIFHNKEFPFNHNISLLRKKLDEYKLEIDFSDCSPDFMTVYASEARYPDPESIITEKDAKYSLQIAYEVRSRILEKVNI
ncbi:MAG TPA: HEPN domain-containing protein [Leptospiraceae bacterium]|nr:HEPN domain-containing protein [Leptospiraceae bacterium]